jgi:hypothetical protein
MPRATRRADETAPTTLQDDRPPRTGLRIGWLVFALLVIALLISGGFIAADRLDRPLAGRPTVPPMLGGSGSVGPSAPVPTSRTTPMPVTPMPTAEPPVGGASVSGVEVERTIVCDGDAVSISGVHNSVTVNGYCSRVDVSGVENTVTIEAAGVIEVSGIRNQVEFLSGAPELSTSGIENTVERG